MSHSRFVFPRLTFLGLLTAVLIVISYALQQSPLAGTLLAVSAYKANLLALGGWGGYWLDRALFPYGRPHQYTHGGAEAVSEFSPATIRRAIIVAACLVCVGLGA